MICLLLLVAAVGVVCQPVMLSKQSLGGGDGFYGLSPAYAYVVNETIEISGPFLLEGRGAVVTCPSQVPSVNWVAPPFE